MFIGSELAPFVINNTRIRVLASLIQINLSTGPTRYPLYHIAREFAALKRKVLSGRCYLFAVRSADNR